MERQMNDETGFPLIDAIDHDILMHREAHFGGQFSIMLDYYKESRKGVQSEFNIERIEELAKLELALQENLAALYLSGSEAEKIASVREAYKSLRALYTVKNAKSSYGRLMADLILSEEEEPEAEIKAIVAEKQSMVSLLIDLLKNEDFHDPLFPGYGLAPGLAVKCLGLIGDKRAVISLFEALGAGDFFEDEQIFKALKAIGEPAKQFFLKVVKGHPINEDNERAAIALIQFKEDSEVSQICLNLLKDPTVQKDVCLPTYLVLVCEGLVDENLRKEFISLSQQSHLPASLKSDMQAVIRAWQSKNQT